MGFNCPHCETEIEQGEIARRIKDVTTEKAALEKQLSKAMKGAKLADTLAEKLEAAETANASLKKAHAADIALSDAGIKDGEVREAFEWQYGRVQATEGEEKPEFGDWLKGLTDKPGDAPAVLKPFLKDLGGAGGAGGGGAGGGGAGGGGAGGGGADFSNRGGGRNGDGVGQFTPDQVGAMSIEELKSNADAINKSWGYS